jgi:DNA-directed RNA polymerase specialized sigma subunit
VRGLYFEGRLLDDVAKELGVSKSWASRIHTKALALMKGSLSAE